MLVLVWFLLLTVSMFNTIQCAIDERKRMKAIIRPKRVPGRVSARVGSRFSGKSTGQCRPLGHTASSSLLSSGSSVTFTVGSQLSPLDAITAPRWVGTVTPHVHLLGPASNFAKGTTC